VRSGLETSYQTLLPDKKKAGFLMQFFIARKDVYGKESEEGWRTEKQRLTLGHILDHLAGKYCLGVFPFTEDGLVKWICLDIDFKRSEFAYRLAKEMFSEHSVILEDTGGRGMHIWILLEPTPLWQVNRLIAKIRSMIAVETFPKQQTFNSKTVGNFVRLPLGINFKTGNRSSFVKSPIMAEVKAYTTCRHRIFDQKNYPNCLYFEDAIGFCTLEVCPKIIREKVSV